jgi:Peptidase family M23/PQQ-like domain
MTKLIRFCLCLLLTGFAAASRVVAQQPTAPCGVVDELDYPIDGLVPGYDDFGLYRQRFGGNHTGLDIGFDRWGDPVYAAARGRVTYSDPAGWGTEKGVVVIEHTFPDGSIAYGVYGHMEESDTILFPPVGTCVERGTVVGTIGWPSRGRPHLHYELRNFLPYDGGPGYVTDNPLDDGWYDPLDFTALWRVKLTPSFLDAITFDRPTTLPPVRLESGTTISVSSDVITAILPPSEVLWRIKADSTITGLRALSGDRIAVHTHSGQVSILQGGRFQAVWTVSEPDMPFVALDEALIFVTNDGGLTAYDTAGNTLWQIAGTAGETTGLLEANGQDIGWAVQTDSGMIWRTVGSDGQLKATAPLAEISAVHALPDGTWLALSGANVMRLNDSDAAVLAALPATAGSSPQITSDTAANLYIYLDDAGKTLLSLDDSGQVRWKTVYNGGGAPLMQAGCQLYLLDTSGRLDVLKASDGAALNSIQLYAGGRRNSSPAARLLSVDAAEHVEVAAGFLTVMTLDGIQLGHNDPACS